MTTRYYMKRRRILKGICPECGDKWETDTDGGETYCVSCGAIVSNVNPVPLPKEQ